jgi:protein-S-isoprenylcysteine O-methyltransferase Ste14
LWSVRHIGVISRTRAQRLGPLVATGPYLLSRNPLYIGNALLWAGFLAWSGLLWLGPPALLLFAVQYSLLAQWEERQLLQSFGESYAAYQRETPRWLPRLGALAAAWRQPARHSWPDVLFSERGTLIAVAIVSLLLIAKAC